MSLGFQETAVPSRSIDPDDGNQIGSGRGRYRHPVPAHRGAERSIHNGPRWRAAGESLGMIIWVRTNGRKQVFRNSAYDETGAAIPALVVIAF